MREFDRSIPYAADFIEEYRIKRKLVLANKKFNKYYPEFSVPSPKKLLFSEEVKIHYFNNDIKMKNESK